MFLVCLKMTDVGQRLVTVELKISVKARLVVNLSSHIGNISSTKSLEILKPKIKKASDIEKTITQYNFPN